jgi:uncharacterized membrane protein
MPANPSKPAGTPPADYLEAIERGVPGSAKQMLDAFHRESEHRRSLEAAEYAFRLRGQVFGFLTSLAAFGVAGYAVYHQQPWIGSIVGGTTILGLVSIFVLGRLVGDKKSGK